MTKLYDDHGLASMAVIFSCQGGGRRVDRAYVWIDRVKLDNDGGRAAWVRSRSRLRRQSGDG
jgi:hypothetical protein